MSRPELPEWLARTTVSANEEPGVQYLRYELCARAMDAWWSEAWADSLKMAEWVTPEVMRASTGELPRSSFMSVLRSLDVVELLDHIDASPEEVLAYLKAKSAELEKAQETEGS